jgi:hypothetical protein
MVQCIDDSALEKIVKIVFQLAGPAAYQYVAKGPACSAVKKSLSNRMSFCTDCCELKSTD